MKREGQITNKDFKSIDVWHNPKCMWVSIPKNANMVYRGICNKTGIKKVKYTDQTADEVVAVIRNPYTRLLSGLGECQKRKKMQKLSTTQLLEKLLHSAADFDEHLEPQAMYLHGKTYTHILLFENLLEETLRVNFFKQHEKIVTNAVRPERTKKSKHHSGSLDDVINQNKELCDEIV